MAGTPVASESFAREYVGVNELRVALEVGPKGRKVVAVATEWPGLARGAKNEEDAVATLTSYLPRYAAVARAAGLDHAFSSDATLRVTERYPGVGSTDFWGISFACSSADLSAVSNEEFERELRVMRACWAVFDDVRASVSEAMRKGPRGGGRDRDHIVRHTLGAERDWARKLEIRTPANAAITDPIELSAFRRDYCDALRRFHADGKTARTWPLRFLIRHTAFHTMDHAWEMQDKDLTDRSV